MKTAEVIMIYEEMVSQWEISHENLFDHNEWLSFPAFREGGLKTLQTDNKIFLPRLSDESNVLQRQLNNLLLRYISFQKSIQF